MISGPAPVQVSGSVDCVSAVGSLQYAADPCCNKTLSFTQCCAPRTVQRQVNKLQSTDPVYLARSCDVNSLNDLLSYLSSYISDQERVNNPSTGCFASTLKSLGTNSRDLQTLWNQFTGFNSVRFIT
jgi:hypothetical protein